ncbi:High mobility group protein DSP1 [Orchesella cincta]|uniref:High mobility group protein DSP1 n=1 Tax=Orchesella cincta TaxID=48709 RepID=A0A1D2MGQ2_ORCCI|nr:High mobility group protein DSP1 [Orchesella cincta]
MKRLFLQHTKALGHFATPMRKVASLNFSFNKGDTEKSGLAKETKSFRFCSALLLVVCIFSSTFVWFDLVHPHSQENQRSSRSCRWELKKTQGSVSAYAFFVRNCWAEWKQEGSEKLSFADQSKKCAALWKEMDAFQKKPFVELQKQDRIRHEKEMRSYVPPTGTIAAKGAGNVPVKGVDEKGEGSQRSETGTLRLLLVPRRAGQVKGANPEFGIGDVAKELGKMWGGMNDAAKSKYQMMASRDKARYQKEMEEYKRLTVSLAAAAAQMEEDDDDDEFEGRRNKNTKTVLRSSEGPATVSIRLLDTTTR